MRLLFHALCVLHCITLSYAGNKELQKLVRMVNSLNTTWKASEEIFDSIPEDVFEQLYGTTLNSTDNIDVLSSFAYANTGMIPESFDARIQWPHCPTIRHIREQGRCGNCWAVAATEAMSDRYCIHLGKVLSLSAADPTTCCTRCRPKPAGCRGAYGPEAWIYWKEEGIVSGGDYRSESGCKPYIFPSLTTSKYDVRPSKAVVTPSCIRRCRPGYKSSFNDDKHYGKRVYKIRGRTIRENEMAIQMEIMTNGPVHAAIEVYEDFLGYKSGVYQNHYGRLKGGHAVRIIGWGVENNVTPYWLVANSWSRKWGMNGCFKIRRGRNEGNIEGRVVAGLPMY